MTFTTMEQLPINSAYSFIFQVSFILPKAILFSLTTTLLIRKINLKNNIKEDF